MSFQPPEIFNIADYFLDQRVREGGGDRIALRLDDRYLTYQEVQLLANRFGGVLRDLGVRPEERVLLLLEDGPEFVEIWKKEFNESLTPGEATIVAERLLEFAQLLVIDSREYRP